MDAQTKGFARFAWATLAFTLLVIVWGAVVRATGSGAGCGSHWPLCNGEFVPPAPAVATLIEFGHRLTSGLSLLLVVGLWWGARKRFEVADPIRKTAGWSLLFMITEALIGAGLVLLEYVADDARLARGFWVGGHLLNTFLLVGAMTACAAFASGRRPPQRKGSEGLATLLGLATAGLLLLGVSGAVTALGDTLFPVASFAEGKAATFSETAHLFVRLRIWHPTLATLIGLVVVATAALAAKARPLGDAPKFAALLASLYATQMLVGLANVWLLAPLSIQLIHLLLADLAWITTILLTLTTLESPQPP